MKRLYVAYGSNLNMEQMARRCPQATVYGTGVLNNWELLFRGASGNAHATIKRKRGSFVPVLVWSVSEADERSLDRYEGFPIYYYKQDVMVEMDGKKKKCMVYIMADDMAASINLPSGTYVQTIRKGYEDCGFNPVYFRECVDRNRAEFKDLVEKFRKYRYYR